jgi:hypothetical protein
MKTHKNPEDSDFDFDFRRPLVRGLDKFHDIFELFIR